jgi:hypothetical protein
VRATISATIRARRCSISERLLLMSILVPFRRADSGRAK